MVRESLIKLRFVASGEYIKGENNILDFKGVPL